MKKLIKYLIESLFDNIDDIISDNEENTDAVGDVIISACNIQLKKDKRNLTNYNLYNNIIYSDAEFYYNLANTAADVLYNFYFYKQTQVYYECKFNVNNSNHDRIYFYNNGGEDRDEYMICYFELKNNHIYYVQNVMSIRTSGRPLFTYLKQKNLLNTSYLHFLIPILKLCSIDYLRLYENEGDVPFNVVKTLSISAPYYANTNSNASLFTSEIVNKLPEIQVPSGNGYTNIISIAKNAYIQFNNGLNVDAEETLYSIIDYFIENGFKKIKKEGNIFINGARHTVDAAGVYELNQLAYNKMFDDYLIKRNIETLSFTEKDRMKYKVLYTGIDYFKDAAPLGDYPYIYSVEFKEKSKDEKGSYIIAYFEYEFYDKNKVYRYTKTLWKVYKTGLVELSKVISS